MNDFHAEIANADLNESKRVVIPIYKAMTGATTDYDTYKVPSAFKLAILGVRAHVVSLAPASEPATVGNIVTANATTFEDRVIGKALNCRATLINQDTTIAILGENHPINLGVLLQKPLDWSKDPQVVLAGQTLRLDVTTIVALAGLTDVSTEYGVELEALLIRVKGDR